MRVFERHSSYAPLDLSGKSRPLTDLEGKKSLWSAFILKEVEAFLRRMFIHNTKKHPEVKIAKNST